MKKMLTISLLLAVSGAYASDYDAKKAPFSSLQTTHPTLCRLGRMAVESISELPIPDNPVCSREEALDTLSLAERACTALATGTPEEQAFIQSVDTTLQHGEKAVPLLIKADKKSIVQCMAAALSHGTEEERLFVKSLEAVVEHGQIALGTLATMDKQALVSHACAGLSAGSEDEQALGKELEGLLLNGYKTFSTIRPEELFAKQEIRALIDRLSMLAKRAKQMENIAVLSPEAIKEIQKPLLDQIEQLKAQIDDLKKQRDAERAERMQLLQTAFAAMQQQDGSRTISAAQTRLIEYTGAEKPARDEHKKS